MSQWSLLNQVEQNNDRNYFVYRCPDPVATITDTPWYTYTNVCPCDPKLSNQTGRGFTACPMGVDETQQKPISGSLLNSQKLQETPLTSQVVGSMFGSNQYVPPQLDPRQLTRIGSAWRSGE